MKAVGIQKMKQWMLEDGNTHDLSVKDVLRLIDERAALLEQHRIIAALCAISEEAYTGQGPGMVLHQLREVRRTAEAAIAKAEAE